LEGARQIKLLGRYVAVAAEVVDVPAFSVHADRNELLGWLRTNQRPPDTTYIVHGEPVAARGLRDAIQDTLGWNAVVPRYLETVRVD
jgi:metallo-beta-lactamase family protein